MRRADRLLQIIQSLRRHGRAVTAQELADELEVSQRTIYRDVLDLQASRVPIEGEAGVGYILRPGYDLPPLMFTIEEIEAIVLGARLARERGDADLARAADDVVAKVAAVLPHHLAAKLKNSALLVPSREMDETSFGPFIAVLRRAVREESRIAIGYRDACGVATERVVWPLALLFYSDATLVGAWCELRQSYRFFRTDRIGSVEATGTRFNSRNGALALEMMTRHCSMT